MSMLPGTPSGPTAPEPSRRSITPPWEGWRAAERGTPWGSHALAAAGGVLVVAGIAVLGIDRLADSGSGTLGATLSLLLVAGALLVLQVVPPVFAAGAIAVVALGVPVGAAFAVIPEVDEASELRAFFALAILGWLACLFFFGSRGRPVLAGLVLFAVWGWFVLEVDEWGASPTVADPFGVTVPFDDGSDDFSFDEEFDDDFGSDFDSGFDDDFGPAPVEPEDNALQVGLVSAGFAALYLVTLARLDVARRRGLATAFVIPGIAALVVAVTALGGELDSALGAGVLAAIGGVLLLYVGTVGRRRFTIWFGAAMATVGALLVAGDITDPNVDLFGSGEGVDLVGFGVAVAVLGAIVVLASEPLRRLLGEPERGDEPIATPPSVTEPPPAVGE
ncbi:MAG TPA: hypothetical protein VFZ83_12665 [Acidimicrobiia bacterium]|nr:hypothetical protein [Acidimicrobiia bacterium]